jgi:hypothetical protein
MKRSIKVLLIVLVSIGAGLGGLYWLATLFSPGSYANAEQYKINFSEKRVKEAIVIFKTENPAYNVPAVTIQKQPALDLVDHQSANPGYWFSVYFYDKNENKIFHCWTRKGHNFDETTFAFDAVNDGLDLGNWKDINDDPGYSENKRLKRKFEKEILEPIQNILERKK